MTRTDGAGWRFRAMGSFVSYGTPKDTKEH